MSQYQLIFTPKASLIIFLAQLRVDPQVYSQYTQLLKFSMDFMREKVICSKYSHFWYTLC